MKAYLLIPGAKKFAHACCCGNSIQYYVRFLIGVESPPRRAAVEERTLPEQVDMVWGATQATMAKAERARMADPERERTEYVAPAERSEHADVFDFVVLQLLTTMKKNILHLLSSEIRGKDF